MKLIKSYILILFLSSCSTFKFTYSDFQGVYSQKGNSKVSLVFKDNEFANIDPGNGHLALYVCCDTIAYGNWGIDNSRGIIYLNSFASLNASFVHMDVKEKTNESDSLVFIIHNPIENNYVKNKTKIREIYYKIAITDKSGSFLANLYTKHDSNVIKLKKPKNTLEKFAITIYPKNEYEGRNISTKEVNTFDYDLKNESSNVFEINMPELNYGYITYLRLEKEFVKIINKNEIEWQNKVYIRSR